MRENRKEIYIEGRKERIVDQLLPYNKIMGGGSGVGLKEFKPDHMEQDGREREMEIESMEVNNNVRENDRPKLRELNMNISTEGLISRGN